MTIEADPYLVSVPLLDAPLTPPPAARIRAFRRHLIQCLRAYQRTRRKDKLIQKPTPVPQGFDAAIVQAGCATCRGHCCMGGGEHAYLDERTMARVHRDHPALGARALIGLYLARLAPLSATGSCLFHGPDGCTLGRGLRAELCNQYYCNGLRDVLRLTPRPAKVQIVATARGQIVAAARGQIMAAGRGQDQSGPSRRSPVLTRDTSGQRQTQP